MWAKFVASFHDSETLVWARLQVVLGVLGSVGLAVATVVFSVDVSPLFSDPKYLVGWMIFSGLVNEALRRHRENWGDRHDQDDDPNEGGHVAHNNP